MRAGFILAGLTNIIGILVCSRGLTNQTLFELYPEVFGFMGCISVILWGLAYLAVSTSRPRALARVFCVEKLVYAATWFYWLQQHGDTLGSLWDKDPLTAFFFSFYGPLDLAFAAFFVKASR